MGHDSTVVVDKNKALYETCKQGKQKQDIIILYISEVYENTYA